MKRQPLLPRKVTKIIDYRAHAEDTMKKFPNTMQYLEQSERADRERRLADIKARERHALVSDLGKVAFVFVTFAYAVTALYLWGPYIIRGVQATMGTWESW